MEASEKSTRLLFTTGPLEEKVLKNPSPPLTIDALFVLNDPPVNNEDLYAECGETTTTLTLSNISEQDAERILYHFKRLHHLTLDNMVILRKEFDNYPICLTSLKLRQCHIHREFLSSWFSGMHVGRYLKSLHLIRMDCRFLAESFTSPKCVFLKGLGGTAHLTIEETDCFKHLLLSPATDNKYLILTLRFNVLRVPLIEKNGKIRSLEIVANSFESFAGEFPKLKRFSMLCPCEPSQLSTILNGLGCDDTLKSLKLPIQPDSIESLKRFRKLEMLKIGSHEIDLSSLDNLSIPVKCRHSSLPKVDGIITLPPNEPNLILSLDPQCLRKIFGYLTDKDLLAMHVTHPRFHAVVGERILPGVQLIDRAYLHKYPLEHWMELYNYVGRNAKALTLYDITEDEAVRILPLFRDLMFLRLRNMEFLSTECIDKFPCQLEELDLSACTMEGDLLEQLFRRVNPTLRRLAFRELKLPFQFESLLKLKNISEFKMFGANADEKLVNFLVQNKNTLEGLYVMYHFSFDYPDCNLSQGKEGYTDPLWEAFPHLDNLKILELFEMEKYKMPLTGSHFPVLEEFAFSAHAGFCSAFINVIQESPIKRLNISLTHNHFAERLHQMKIARFKNLERLHLHNITLGVGDVKYPLCKFKELKKLTITRGTTLAFLLINLISELQKLEQLNFDETLRMSFDKDYLRDYLENNQRTIWINGYEW